MLNINYPGLSSKNNKDTFLTENSKKMLNKREILKKYFPDWKERVDYQIKQENIYRSGLARMAEAKRCGMKFKLNEQEQDAFDYLNGQNFYKKYQSLQVPPNIFDTRNTFLLKIEKNKIMRENFLKSYNKIENKN